MASDLPRLRELGFDRKFGPDFMDGLVFTDQDDIAVMFCGAWSRAEVHLCIDKNWSTPGARWQVLKDIHLAMEKSLKQKGVGQAITWFGDELKRFKRRLTTTGWVKSELTSWHKEL